MQSAKGMRAALLRKNMEGKLLKKRYVAEQFVYRSPIFGNKKWLTWAYYA